jgi:cysteine synthase A
MPPATILDRIGTTALLPLTRIRPRSGARLVLKLESENPTGSMKDRMALAMIRAARADGRLAGGGAVVEYTGGSTGVSLALVCSVLGHPLHIVTSDAFAREKLDHMRLLGARLTVLPSDGGKMTGALTRAMIAEAGRIAAATGAFGTDQMQNRDQLAAYRAMAAEIRAEGPVDALVQSVGTAASVIGMAAELRPQGVKIVAVEPAESAVLSGGPSGAHRIDGIGAGYVVPLWDPAAVDALETVTTAEATAMALRLAREEALFCGTSTGANVVAALRVADRLGPGATVATVMCDSGMKSMARMAAALDQASA